MAKKKISHLNEEFDVKLFAIIARKNFYILILLMIVSVITAFIYLRYTHPIYQSDAIIKIGSQNNANKILNMQSAPIYEGMGMNLLAGNIEVLRSKLMRLKN